MKKINHFSKGERSIKSKKTEKGQKKSKKNKQQRKKKEAVKGYPAETTRKN